MSDPRRRSLVLCVAVLLLTAPVLPATGVGAETGVPSTSGGPNAASIASASEVASNATPPNRSAVDRKQAAIEAIESMDSSWRFQRRQRERAIERLNGTLSAYRDGAHVSTHSVFRDDRRALRRLATTAWTDSTTADRAADLVVSADLATVNTAIDDARIALRRTGDRIDDPRERRRAERAMQRAIRSRNRALDVLDDRGWGKRHSINRVRALVHLEAAWTHARYALGVLDRSTPPTVSIDSRADPPRNGSVPTTLTIRGNVSDVRAYEIGNVSVAVNGTQVGSAPIDASPAPARNASFSANVTLTGPVAEVSVTVTDHDRWYRGWGAVRSTGRWHRLGRSDDRVDGGGSSKRFAWHRHGGGEVDVQSETAVVRFDGDGLPDTYEAGVVGTDPLYPDSDSRVTEANESGDGVLDGGEDFDDDRLIAFAEYDRGTDPFENDTDDDGLPDRFEASIPALFDPTDVDTDGDGVADGSEDVDGDGLHATAEYANGTSMARSDSDGDELSDAEEVVMQGTSPLDRDSDADGLDDAEELRLDVDPLVADTDGDGTVDGNETFTTVAVGEETGVRISLSGEGDVAAHVSVENLSQPSTTDFLAGPVVRIQNRTGFEAATVTIPLDGNVSPADAGNLSVYKWNPDDDRPWHPLNSSVDAANGTASANVSSFSFFTVMDGPRWEEAITDTVSPSWPRHASFADLSGWDVEGEVTAVGGDLLVSGGRDVQVDPDIVVATDGSGDYERIQPAIDAAGDGETILVREGTYDGAVVVDSSVSIVGRDVTLDGSRSGGVANYGVKLVGDALVTISGLTITNFQNGIRVDEFSGNLTMTDVDVVENEERGVLVQGFDGDWTLSKTRITDNGASGVVTFRFSGGLEMSRTSLSRNGKYGLITGFIEDGMSCDCRFRDVTVSDNQNSGLAIGRLPGEYRITRSTVSNNSVGISFNDRHDVTLSDVRFVENELGVGARGTSGDFELTGVFFSGRTYGPGPHRRPPTSSGIKAGFSTADWVLTDVVAAGHIKSGLQAYKSKGDWSLRDVKLSGNGLSNLHADESAGDWTLSNVDLSAGGDVGLRAPSSSGDWQLSNAKLTENANDGLRITGSAGTWTIENSDVSGNGGNGIDARSTSGGLTVTRSKLVGNVEEGIDALGAESTVSASNNWWGDAEGPGENQINGTVETEPHCQSPSCGTGDVASAIEREDSSFRLANEVDGRSPVAPSHEVVVTSRAHRQFTFRDDVSEIVVSARVSGHGSRSSSARLAVDSGSDEEIVADVVSRTDRARVESADLSRFAGETVAVEVVAESGAEIRVDWIDVAYDTDGDGLRDLIENADLGMPAGPRPGASLAALDPTNPDSDGDGLLDGEELTDVTTHPRLGGLTNEISVRAEAAAADPTRENSDGGGLTDSEEVETGSDPFVLETLVVGYVIPTMTHGPEDTLEDRQPMTVGEANGLQAGGGSDSDLIAWPSKQYYDPFFCIKELRPGPGCSGAWMQGVEIRDGHFYVYVPFVVYAQSDVDFGEAPYELSLSPHWTANVVKHVNTSGTLASSQSLRGYIVYEYPEEVADFELQRRIFRPLGELSLDADLSNTVFERSGPSSVGRRYSVSTSTTLPRTEAMLQDTQTVLEQGINIAFAAEAGYAVAIETGSSLRGALAFLYHLAKSQTSTPPTSVEDVAEKVGQRGIAAFEEKVRETQGRIDEDVFGDGVIRTVGPTIIRQN